MQIRTIREFLKLESTSGLILLIMAVLAITCSNTSLYPYYKAFLNFKLGVHAEVIQFSKPVLLWINDGLMALFFLLVGLEVKRELFEGELSSVRKATLPAAAAVGGMAIPGLVYVLFNYGNPLAMHGWAIPMATDIAFSLAILALLRARVPVSLKIFLTALAIFDDIGAIVIIAAFYTSNLSLLMLFLAGGFTLILALMNRMHVQNPFVYAIVGIALWACVLKSGVHATLAGIIIAFAIPLRDHTDPAISPVRLLEHALHPWVAYGVLPIFAFANAGVHFNGLTLSEFFNPITLGIALGLFIGKQLGVWLFSWVAIKLNLARLPHGTNQFSIYGVGLIAGVGFTMSLFIGTLAFVQAEQLYIELVRLGVIIGSLLSGVFGYCVLYLNHAPLGRGTH